MHVCLILFPGFQMLSHGLACEVLRVANACAGQELFSWQTRTVADTPVAAADGTEIAGQLTGWSGAQGFDLVLLCAGSGPPHHLPLGLRGFLARAEAAGATLGGIDAGGVILGRLGLLAGREAVLPHEPDPCLLRASPDIALSRSSFAFDRRRLTTAGGLATADAMLAWIARAQGSALAARTAGTLAHGRIRDAGERQCLPRAADPLLDRMQAIMAARIESPLPVARIADELELSPKQLRLRCRKALNSTPAQVYLDLRLHRASQLVQETGCSVSEIAQATGFASPSAFTRSYRARFGIAPRSQRKACRGPQQPKPVSSL